MVVAIMLDLQWSHKRHTAVFAGVQQYAKEEGCSCSVTECPLDPASSVEQWLGTERTLAASMQDWQPPIGVFVGIEVVGRMVAQMCLNRGWRVPEDVAIITGLNEEAYCENPRPSLTSIEIGYERNGYEAAKLLDRLMDGESPPTQPILLPPVGVVVRESTDFFSVDDPQVAGALKFIAENCHRPIHVNDVARAVVAETQTLQLRFQKHLDRSIASVIRSTRIERAKRELTNSDDPLETIARKVGFRRAEQMYLVFKRELGISPSEYRQQRQ